MRAYYHYPKPYPPDYNKRQRSLRPDWVREEGYWPKTQRSFSRIVPLLTDAGIASKGRVTALEARLEGTGATAQTGQGGAERENETDSIHPTAPTGWIGRTCARVRGFAAQKKEWVKLNTAYVFGCTIPASLAPFATSYVARKMGVDLASASTYMASIPQFLIGLTGLCTSWFFMQRKRYDEKQGDHRALYLDTLKLGARASAAQFITWGLTWPLTSAVVYLFNPPVALAVFLQTQVFDKAPFTLLFNYFNRGYVKRLERMGAAPDSEARTPTGADVEPSV